MQRTELVLRPNCLLTRRPLIFLTGRRSLFYYRKPWNYIQYYLFEHGYQVDVMKLPFCQTHQRLQYLENRLHKLSDHHIICDDVTYAELGALLSKVKNSTVTVINSPSVETPSHYSLTIQGSRFSLSYWLHQRYLALKGFKTAAPETLMINPTDKSLNQILDHCVQLAELDFYELDLNPRT